MNTKFIILIFLIINTSNVFAQDNEPLVTDRPDATESAVTVGDGTLQVESGFVYEQFESSSRNYTETNFHIATTLFRYGIGEDFELRLHGKIQSRIIELFDKSKVYYGLNNVSIGMKYQFYESSNAGTNGAVLASVILPVGNFEFSSSSIDPALLVALSQDISEHFSISTNFGGIYQNDDNEFVYLYSLALGIGITEKIGGFIELFGGIRNSISPEHILDGGFTYLVNNDIQFDLSAGTRIFFEDTSWFINSGISIRFQGN